MIKNYKDHRLSSGRDIFNAGDQVVVKNRDSEHFLKMGVIVSIYYDSINDQYLSILSDYTKKIFEVSSDDVEKILQIINVDTGEVFNIVKSDITELSRYGLIKFDFSRKVYFFYEIDKWQMDNYII